MQAQYHRQITEQALKGYFSPRALKVIVSANLGQDSPWRGLFGHPEYHFDESQFTAGWNYVAEQRSSVNIRLSQGKTADAWQAFGRLTHAVQDFFAHSNYVRLWMENHADRNRDERAASIDPVDEEIMKSSHLISGNIYYPLEVFTFLPWFKEWARQRLPRDAHAWMNLDSPGQGPLFELALQAAELRTKLEYDWLCRPMTPNMLRAFRDW